MQSCFTEIFIENDYKDMWQIVSKRGKSDKSGMPHKLLKPLQIQQNQAFTEALKI